MKFAEVALIQPSDRAAWSLPKGLIERGETPENAAIREALEETGLSCDILRAHRHDQILLHCEMGKPADADL